MATPTWLCWKCHALLDDVLLPFARLAKCKHCKADLHVCRMCEFFDTSVSNSCREPIAEKVNDKTRANFCGYFQPAEKTTAIKSQNLDDNKAALAGLFGLEQDDKNFADSDADKSKQALDALFGLDDNKSG